MSMNTSLLIRIVLYGVLKMYLCILMSPIKTKIFLKEASKYLSKISIIISINNLLLICVMLKKDIDSLIINLK